MLRQSQYVKRAAPQHINCTCHHKERRETFSIWAEVICIIGVRIRYRLLQVRAPLVARWYGWVCLGCCFVSREHSWSQKRRDAVEMASRVLRISPGKWKKVHSIQPYTSYIISIFSRTRCSFEALGRCDQCQPNSHNFGVLRHYVSVTSFMDDSSYFLDDYKLYTLYRRSSTTLYKKIRSL